MNASIFKLRNWIKSNKFEFLVLSAILLVAAFMRLYRISDYMTFLGDEGRDVILVRRFLLHGDIMLIGPGTSIGNMYLGPLYYYMMAPALFLFNYSPVGPAVMIATLGIITVWFVYYAAKQWFGTKAGLISAGLYAITPTVIIYSHSSWNPNIMPFFAILSIWAIWKVWKFNKLNWLNVVGVSLAACLQSHYLGLLLVPALGIFWLWTGVKLWKSKLRKEFLVKAFLMLVIFFLIMSPLFIFDIRHNFMNFKAIKTFFSDRQTTVSIKPWKAIPDLLPQFSFITGRLVTGYNEMIAKWGSLFLIGGAVYLIKKTKLKIADDKFGGVLLLGGWVGFGIIGLALYKQQIYDHYYGFLFPAFSILTGLTISLIWENLRIFGRWIAIASILLLVYVNLLANPLQYQPSKQLGRSIDVSNFILKEASESNFNFAVIAERNYEGAYQYFLETDSRFRVIDPQNTKDTITQQLFVVCEMEKSKCDPTHNPKTEVAAFGWSKIDTSWDVDGATVYKLVHNYPQK